MTNSSWMVSRKERASEFPLDVQSRGRILTEVEGDFASALEKIFSQGHHEFETVAVKLTEYGVKAPACGLREWNSGTLENELKVLNASLDTAFEETGYGA